MSNDTKTVTEKIDTPSTANDKGQKMIIGIVGVVAFGLVASLFIDSGPKQDITADNKAQEVASDDSYNSGSEDFITASKRRQEAIARANSANTNTTKNGLSSISNDTTFNQGEAYEKWKQQEYVRVLNSRTSQFGVKPQAQLQKVSSKDNFDAQQAMSTKSNPLRASNTGESAIKSRDSIYSNVGENLIGDDINNNYQGAVNDGKVLIATGSMIDGALDQNVISDFAGTWTGHITKDVYSIDRQYILIPKGTTITGASLNVNNINQPIQHRMGLTVDWLVLPDGQRISMKSSGDATDQMGVNAIKGDVNRHLMWKFGSVAAYALISGATPETQYNAFGAPQNSSFKTRASDGMREQLSPMVLEYLSLVPTITLKTGTPIKIILKDDVYTKPWKRVNTTVYG